MFNKLLSLFLSMVIVWESILFLIFMLKRQQLINYMPSSNGIPQGSVPRSDIDYVKLKGRISANLPETVQVNL
ncbi:MAG: hypothetical protein U0T83_07315 [Bacteriovoracaceae bacterium]